MDFIKARHPKCIHPKFGQNYQNLILAIDASNTMYQFLIKTQSKIFWDIAISKNNINMPTDWLGNKTGHLVGLLSRTLFCI